MKPLVSPYLWLLVLQGGLLAGWWRRRRAVAATDERRILHSLAVTWIVMTALSFEPVNLLLAFPLEVRDSPPAAAPDVIFVLGDGVIRGADPADDRVTTAEWLRLRRAAAWWKERRTARIVLSGRSQAQDRAPERLGELARAALVAEGISDSVITVEPRSRTTWEHVGEALKLPGISRALRVGIVTSDWHVRRARIVFRGAFAELQWRSGSSGRVERNWPSLLPSSEALAESVALFKEDVGNVAYVLRRVVATP